MVVVAAVGSFRPVTYNMDKYRKIYLIDRGVSGFWSKEPGRMRIVLYAYHPVLPAKQSWYPCESTVHLSVVTISYLALIVVYPHCSNTSPTCA